MANNQSKRGGLVSLEGLLMRAIDNLAMPSGNVWYEFASDEKNASLAIQCSGDVAVDMSINTGDTVFTIKSGTVLALDAQLAGLRLQFRHRQASAQTLQVMRLI